MIRRLRESRFLRRCQPFTIELTNNDDLDHNVGIYQGEKEIFRGDEFKGPGETMTYAIAALEPGEYTFICDIHPGPAMTGTLTVK